MATEIMTDPNLYEHRFNAMNTDVAAWSWSVRSHAEQALWAVEEFFTDTERDLSRFLPQSDLSTLNAWAGKGPVPVSPVLWTVLSLALQHAEASQGIYDPTILSDLTHLGYDRSFEEIAHLDRECRPPDALPHRPGWRQVILNRQDRTVSLPAGVGIDLGGIAKGWAVDQAAAQLGRWGPALVDAGGDMRVTASIAGEAWPIAVQDPRDPACDLLVLRISQGAVATSSITKRRWLCNGRWMHHLIDPRTHQPADTDLHTVTVLAASTVEAEIAAKVALIQGSVDGAAYLRQRKLAAILIRNDDSQEHIGHLPIDTQMVQVHRTWL